MYRVQKKHILLQAIVAVGMVSGSFMLANWAMTAILLLFALILLKDVFTSLQTSYRIDEKGLSEWVGNREKWKINWSDITMITRTKKHPSWVVIGVGDDNKMIKSNLIDFSLFVKDLVTHTVINSKVVLHHTIVMQAEVDLDLDQEGRVKSASRQKFIETSRKA